MKKIIALLLALTMVLSLVACGSKEASAPTAETTTSVDTASVEAAEWPTGTITLTVPAKAGGGTDVLMRQFAQAMQDATGQSFVVVNDDSGNGTVAAESVRNAEGDGTNFLIANTGLCGIIASGQYPHGFDEFAMCGMVTTPSTEGAAVFVPANSPFETFEDFVKYAQENPAELVAGVQANGAGHFATLLLADAIGAEFTIVDCGGNADRTTALMGNSIDFSIMNFTGEDQYVKSGDLRCLVNLTDVQSQLLPEVPLITEYGYDPIDLSMCATMLAPADTDPAIIKAISQVLEEVSKSEELQAAYAKLGAAWEYMTPEDSAAFVANIQEMYNDAYALMD